MKIHKFCALIAVCLFFTGCISPTRKTTDDFQKSPSHIRVATLALDNNPLDQAFFQSVQANSSVDIWIFQELNVKNVSSRDIGTPVESHHRIAELKNKYPIFILLPLNPQPNQQCECIAVLSRYDLINYHVLPLPSYRKSRNSLITTLNTSQGIIRLVNTDHDAYPTSHANYMRKRQASCLFTMLAKDQRQPTLVGGDFNSVGAMYDPFGWASANEINALNKLAAKHGFVSFTADEDVPTHYSCWGTFKLDHWFATENRVKIRRDGVAYFSDSTKHLIYWCDFSIEN